MDVNIVNCVCIIQHGKHISIPKHSMKNQFWGILLSTWIQILFLALLQTNLLFFRCLCVWKRKIYCWTLGGNENEKFSMFKMLVWLGKKRFPRSWIEVTIASSETYFWFFLNALYSAFVVMCSFIFIRNILENAFFTFRGQNVRKKTYKTDIHTQLRIE